MWFKPAGCKDSSAGARSNVGADLLRSVGKGMLRKRDSNIFALHFISTSGPKEMLQQIFFFSEHFDPLPPPSIPLPLYFPPTPLGTFQHICSHGTGYVVFYNFFLSSTADAAVKDGREPPDLVLITTEARMYLQVSSQALLNRCSQVFHRYTSALAFHHFIENLHLKQRLAHKSRDFYCSFQHYRYEQQHTSVFLYNFYTHLQKDAHHLQPCWATAMFMEGRSEIVAEVRPQFFMVLDFC